MLKSARGKIYICPEIWKTDITNFSDLGEGVGETISQTSSQLSGARQIKKNITPIITTKFCSHIRGCKQNLENICVRPPVCALTHMQIYICIKKKKNLNN